MTPSEIADSLDQLSRKLRVGCGNHGCRISPPEGMGTNSICQCMPIKFAKEFLELATVCEEQRYEWRKP